MTRFQRVMEGITGIILALAGSFLILHPRNGYGFVCLVFCISLILAGIRFLIYYISMARHMVGGRIILYAGLITLDLGLFAFDIGTSSRPYILLYLMGLHAFSGMVDILRALEAKRYNAPHWRLKLTGGAANILASAVCLVFFRETWIVTYIYCGGLFYSAFTHFVSAFRRTVPMYVQ